MKFTKYSNVIEFYNDTYEVLLNHESQNLIPLGNLIIGYEGKDKVGWRDPANWLMATVSDEKNILVTALMTPPHNIAIYATDNIMNQYALDCLVDNLLKESIPGVISEKSLAQCFAENYTRKKGLSYKTTMSQRIYELKRVNPNIEKTGKVRLLDKKDMCFFPYWIEAFSAANVYGSLEMLIPMDLEPYEYRLSTKKLYILEDEGMPVSMAGYTREMEKAIGVAFVYTPPYFRKKGYATSCVAQISQMALDRGFERCVLYTDLENPTSNSIYIKIGYTPVCDSLMLTFE